MSVQLEQVFDLADRSARARSRGERWNRFEDLRQEGAIAGWLALQKKPDAPAAYIQRSIVNRMNDVLRHDSSFGSPRQAGGRGYQQVDFVEWPEDFEPQAEGDVGGAEVAHLLDSTLDEVDAEIARRKVLDGDLDKEIAHSFSRRPGWVSDRWRKRIKPTLTNALKEAA